ncbi:MAG TPA: glutamine amidotransferase [Polyangiaceae bacterium]|nr:glutamine amidotransferase [Polyangiaceae bacterium]
MKLIVLRTGDAEPTVAARRGEFFAWIVRETSPAWAGLWEERDVRGGGPLPDPRDADGFIMTGSPSSVTERAPWMLRAEELLRGIVAAGVPFFGICFGHQLMASALGGEVVRNPRGREMGTVEVRVRDGADPLLAALPRAFAANATHVDVVSKPPPGARVLAETDLDPCAIYAVGAATKCVQFHPEIDGDAMRRYVDVRAGLVEAEGGDPRALRAGAADTPEAAALLRNFARLVRHGM